MSHSYSSSEHGSKKTKDNGANHFEQAAREREVIERNASRKSTQRDAAAEEGKIAKYGSQL